MASVSFRGVAHPPPNPHGRETAADLSAAEIGTTNLGRNGGLPLLVEHEHSHPAGRVLASWEGRNGELRVAGVVDDAHAARDVRSGAMRGLSLGTGVVLDAQGRAMGRMQDELSLCAEPRRAGCYIDTVDGKNVRTVACHSKSNAGALRPLALALHHKCAKGHLSVGKGATNGRSRKRRCTHDGRPATTRLDFRRYGLQGNVRGAQARE